MAVGRLLGVGGLAALMGGCAQVGETWSEWIALLPPAMPTPTPDSGEVFYAAIEGLALHALPSGASHIVARLTLHQRVTRLRLCRPGGMGRRCAAPVAAARAPGTPGGPGGEPGAARDGR